LNTGSVLIGGKQCSALLACGCVDDPPTALLLAANQLSSELLQGAPIADATAQGNLPNGGHHIFSRYTQQTQPQ
jgi:hypothetical protein